jgi:D-arabinose 1-dehydrogenase-like Zn-dependent alcohol dehydrogenase
LVIFCEICIGRCIGLTRSQFNENYKLEEIPTPVPQRNEVLVRIVAASFCHTDYQVYKGAYHTQLPHTGSHEPVGTIAALGPDASKKWKVGDRVGVYLFRSPCGSCADCRWYATEHEGKLNARYCKDKAMGGILKADGGFAEYMLSFDDAIMRVPEGLPLDQAAPLMCAGCTMWTAILEAKTNKGSTMAIVGVGGLGILGIQFAKAMGYRVVAIGSRDNATNLAIIPDGLGPDLYVNRKRPEANQQILDFTEGRGLDFTVVSTDDVEVNDWILHELHPRATAVVLGLPESGFTFDAFNLVFREIVVKGSLHSSVEEMEQMLKVAAEHNIRSEIARVPIEEAEDLPERIAKREIAGRAVVIM